MAISFNGKSQATEVACFDACGLPLNERVRFTFSIHVNVIPSDSFHFIINFAFATHVILKRPDKFFKSTDRSVKRTVLHASLKVGI